MATFLVHVTFLMFGLSLFGIGAYGQYLHKQGQKFPISPKMCRHLCAAGAMCAFMVGYLGSR